MSKKNRFFQKYNNTEKVIKKIKLFETLKDRDWSPKRFKKKLKKFILSKQNLLKQKKNNIKLKNDGAKIIVRDIKKFLKNHG